MRVQGYALLRHSWSYEVITIQIVGAGQLGSRHLQALQAVETPLSIHVVDPSPASLEVARQRFEALIGVTKHSICFDTVVEPSESVDLAIVATNANTRHEAALALLRASQVRFMVLEKLLFDQSAPYDSFVKELASTGTQAWVNCPMRVMAPYESIRQQLGGRPINYRVEGSQFGLVTNAIHYLDHVVHLTGCSEFTIDCADLDAQTIPSKRAGFLELTGRLFARFADGSRCEIVCHAEGNAPVLVEISTPAARWLVRESESKLWASAADTNWAWSEQPARIPYQSEMTAQVVRDLLAYGSCGLTPITQSISTHKALLEPLRDWLRTGNPTLDHFPFT